MAEETPVIPWDEIREKYKAGATVKSLCAEYGVRDMTVYQRVKRENWNGTAKRVQGHVVKAVNALVSKEVAKIVPDIADAAERYKSKALATAERLVSSVHDALPEAAPRDLSGLASALLSSDTVARRTLGLDALDGSQVNIAVTMHSHVLPQPSRPFVDYRRTIDLPTEQENKGNQPEST